MLSSFFTRVESSSGRLGSQDQAKKAAADRALELVESGMTLGLGTGSTVEFFLQGLAHRVKQGLEVRCVPTSVATERRARELNIPLLGPASFPLLGNDLCVDGADRVDLQGFLIKGGGGALLREKLVASHSSRVCILVDSSKLVTSFDEGFALPVECVPFGVESTMALLAQLDCEPGLRTLDDGQPLCTDNGNYIVDCLFREIPDPGTTLMCLLSLPGVVEVGLFSDLLDVLIVGFADGTTLDWDGSLSNS